MKPPPRVTICVPAYNGRQHVAECIASIRAQTFKDYEVVFCDDESSDGTLDFARELAQGDGRFRFIANQRRLGLAGNWNNCARQARGEWVKFVFQDDIIKPSCLEKLLAACQREGRPFGFCGRDFIFEDGVTETVRHSFLEHKRRLRSDYQNAPAIEAKLAARIMAREPSRNLAGEPTVTLIHKSIFSELGGFDEALIQLCDAEFWSRVMVNHGAAFVAEDLATFRIHAKAATALNHGHRAFRTNVLDPLVMQYHFAFSPCFKPARNPQLAGKSALSLRKECARNAARAWRQAGEPADGSLLSEWRTVTSCHPGIQIMARLGRVVEFLGRLRRRIFPNSLWQWRANARTFLRFLEECLPHNGISRLLYLKQFQKQKAEIGDLPHGFSVVIVTRNRRQFLSWAIEALIENTAEPFEVIIMDNASGDGTCEMCQKLEKQHPGIVYYVPLRRNYGTNAYALGFLRARYKFLVDMDDDVLALSKGWDKATAKAFSVIPRLGFLAMNVVQDKYTDGAKPDISNYSESIFPDTMMEIGPAGGWFAVTTRAIYNQAGGFIFRPYKPFHLEDGEFVGEISKKGYIYGILKKAFVYHACGPYWNSAYGYNTIWREKYRRDYKDYLPRITAVQIDDVPSVKYARSMLARAEQLA